MKLLKDYFELQQKIYDYFGYEEDWVVIPLEDSTNYFWRIVDNSAVIFANKMEDFQTEEYYENEIYCQRFLPKHVYETEDYTMVCVDTHTDGNKFLQVFDNKKKIPDDVTLP